MVDGWNAWFFSDRRKVFFTVSSLPIFVSKHCIERRMKKLNPISRAPYKQSQVMSEWSGYGRNRQSVGQLWLGFLHFYAGDWDDK